MDEPKRLHAAVRDRDGNIWVRGQKWWHCQIRLEKWLWPSLNEQYGPLMVDAETDRVEHKRKRL